MMPDRGANPPPPGAKPWWQDLSDHSDRAEVRQEIGRLIREGLVTVRPRAGDPERVDVIPRGTSADTPLGGA